MNDTGNPDFVPYPSSAIGPIMSEALKIEGETKDKKSHFEGMGIDLDRPRVNVITKEEFESRAEMIFKILWDKLSLSFGPYGAPTMIYDYPFKHVTKDGFTIMKNISFDASSSKLDQTICDLVEDICARLNYAVGDGTTTAVIATNSLYNSYRKHKDEFIQNRWMPRDILAAFNTIKGNIIENLQSKAVQIRSTDPDVLAKNIADVVYISSNGDEELTQMISDLYRTLGAPSITAKKSDNGETYAEVISGYKFELMLNDKLYINTDNNEMSVNEADVIIFGTKVTRNIYEKILKPLNEESRTRGRKLIVAANSYDDIAMRQVISRDLRFEYEKTKSINMVLTTYRAVSEHHRKMVEDFAALCGTEVLTRTAVDEIINTIWSGDTQQRHICEVLPLDTRGIPDTAVVKFKPDDSNGTQPMQGQVFISDSAESGPYTLYMETIDTPFKVGYVRDCELGLKTSQFGNFYYDNELIERIRQDAKNELTEVEDKYKNLGTFTLKVSNAQERYQALQLKTGIIHVGGDSEMSIGMNRDTVDDALKAAASAYENGVVLGCNVNLIQACQYVGWEYKTNTEKKESEQADLIVLLCKILEDAYSDVYKTVLRNAFPNEDCRNVNGDIIFDVTHPYDLAINNALLDRGRIGGESPEPPTSSTVHDLIVEYSVKENMVYDVSKGEFSEKIINSLMTDEQVLIATIELVSLLITGNQVIVTQRHNF